MRILMVTEWFDPEPNLKGLVFARALAARGHEVRVITGFPNYPGGTLYPGYRMRLRMRETMDGIPVTRVPLFPSHDRSAARRVATYASFALAASTIGAWRAGPADVVYAYWPPPTVGVAAAVLSAVTGAPFVLDIQDLWPESVAESGMLGGATAMRAIGACCDWVYRRASGIAVNSGGFKTALEARGVNAERLEVIHNWCDESALAPSAPDRGLAARLGLPADGFLVVLAGTLGLAQGLDTVVDAAVLCRDLAPQAHFALVGDGVEKARVESRARSLGLGNVRFVARQPMAQMGPILSLAGALLISLRDAPLFSITIPSRTQAYLAAGRPIILAGRGEAAALVQRSGGGVCCPPGDPPALAEAVRRLAALPQAERDAMGQRGREFYQRELSLSAGVTRFLDLFGRVTA